MTLLVSAGKSAFWQIRVRSNKSQTSSSGENERLLTVPPSPSGRMYACKYVGVYVSIR